MATLTDLRLGVNELYEGLEHTMLYERLEYIVLYWRVLRTMLY